MKLRTRNEYDEVKAAVEALIAEASFVETHERTSEYEMLEKRALKTLAGRAMIEYQEGKCIPSDQAMLHFKRFVTSRGARFCLNLQTKGKENRTF